MFESLKPSKLYSGVFSSYNAPLNVVWIENGLYVVKRACIFSAFISENIKNSNKYIFQNWAINSIDNNRDLNKSLSVFFILAFEKIDCVEDFKDTLSKWWYLVGSFDINKGDTIFTKSSPFGNRNFINSFTKGIVSNIFGNNYCFILSDCPSTPGTEGSPVYLTNR
ncbi:hypothetical protein NQ314_012805 [Rhamnusium bicolor]|uniref:Peroxisomal leader peptide-processing protease n=1 Tax=Rhamnusium bicolor TaxID=1586634 RepID=A0AAV8XA91_9CUCU|nr:hypothetical protein NQ314_012805 [Rhamnusium bicolor]